MATLEALRARVDPPAGATLEGLKARTKHLVPTEEPSALETLYEGAVKAPARNLYAGYLQSGGGLYDLGANVAMIAGRLGATDREGKRAFRETEAALREMAQELYGESLQYMDDNILAKVYQGLGAAPAAIAELISGTRLLGTATKGFAAVEALHAADKGPEEVALAAARGALTGKAFEAAAPLTRPPRVAALTTIGAGQGAAAGGGVEDITAGAATLGILGLTGGRGHVSLRDLRQRAAKAQRQEPTIARPGARPEDVLELTERARPEPEPVSPAAPVSEIPRRAEPPATIPTAALPAPSPALQERISPVPRAERSTPYTARAIREPGVIPVAPGRPAERGAPFERPEAPAVPGVLTGEAPTAPGAFPRVTIGGRELTFEQARVLSRAENLADAPFLVFDERTATGFEGIFPTAKEAQAFIEASPNERFLDFGTPRQIEELNPSGPESEAFMLQRVKEVIGREFIANEPRAVPTPSTPERQGFERAIETEHGTTRIVFPDETHERLFDLAEGRPDKTKARLLYSTLEGYVLERFKSPADVISLAREYREEVLDQAQSAARYREGRPEAAPLVIDPDEQVRYLQRPTLESLRARVGPPLGQEPEALGEVQTIERPQVAAEVGGPAAGEGKQITPRDASDLATMNRSALLNFAERIGFDDVKAGRKVFLEIPTRIARTFGLEGEGVDQRLANLDLTPDTLAAMQRAYDRGKDAAFARRSRPEGPQTSVPTDQLESLAVELYQADNRSGFSEPFTGADRQRLKNIIAEISERKARTPFDVARDLRRIAGVVDPPRGPAEVIRGITETELTDQGPQTVIPVAPTPEVPAVFRSEIEGRADLPPPGGRPKRQRIPIEAGIGVPETTEVRGPDGSIRVEVVRKPPPADTPTALGAIKFRSAKRSTDSYLDAADRQRNVPTLTREQKTLAAEARESNLAAFDAAYQELYRRTEAGSEQGVEIEAITARDKVTTFKFEPGPEGLENLRETKVRYEKLPITEFYTFPGPLSGLKKQWHRAATEIIDSLAEGKYSPFARYLGGYPFKDPTMGRLPERAEYLGKRGETQGTIYRTNRVTGRLNDTLRKASVEDQRAALDYLTTEGADPKSLPSSVRGVAVAAKSAIKRVGRELVRRGMLSQEAYDAHADAYLPRVYLKHLMERSGFGAGLKISDQGYLKKRTDLPEEYRDLYLGEVKDVGFLVTKAISQPARDLAMTDFLRDLSRNPEWVLPESMVEWTAPGMKEPRKVTPFWLKSEAGLLRRRAAAMPDLEQRARAKEIADGMDALADDALGAVKGVPKDFRRMPDSPRYGDLRGLVVRKEIHDDIVGASGVWVGEKGAYDKTFDKLGSFNAFWKDMKVTKNPPTQVRNFVSNGVLLDLSGVPFQKLPGLYIRAFNEIRKNGRYYRIAVKHGIPASTFTAAELYRIQPDLLRVKGEKGGVGGKLARMAEPLVRLSNKTGDLYQFSETWGKVVKIIDAMEREGMTERQAVAAAQEALFDYSLVPPLVRALRTRPIGAPFITFYYKAFPAVMKGAIKHPGKMAKYLIIPYLLGDALVADLNDVTPEDVDKLRKALPRWLQDQGHVYLYPYRDESGRWAFVNYGYFLPWAMHERTARNAMQVATGSYEGSVNDFMSEVGVLSGPVPQIIAAIQTGVDPWTGREIVKDTDPPREQIYKLMMYAWRMGGPSFLTDQGVVGHMQRSLSGTPTYYGDPPLSPEQAAGRAVGVNIYPVDPVQSRGRNIRRKVFEIKEQQRAMRRGLRNRGLNAEQRKELIGQHREQIKRLVEDLREYKKRSEVHPNLRAGTQRPGGVSADRQ